MKTLVTGATGFVGQHLIPTLEHPHTLSRSSKANSLHGRYQWDTKSLPPSESFNGVEAIVNLAGESIGKRWSTKTKKRIYESRISTTKNVVKGIAKLDKKPKIFIQISGTDIYAESLSPVNEQGKIDPDKNFLARVAYDWEQEAKKVEELGVKLVIIRSAFMLGSPGFAKIVKLTQFGLGGWFMPGKQLFSWIHIEDVIRTIHRAMQPDSPSILNTAIPTTNKEFFQAVGKAVNMPVITPVPKFLSRIAIGEFAQTLHQSTGVTTQYKHLEHTNLNEALQDILTKRL